MGCAAKKIQDIKSKKLFEYQSFVPYSNHFLSTRQKVSTIEKHTEIKALNQELHSRAAPNVEAYHRVNGPDTGRNSGGRRIIKKDLLAIRHLTMI